MTITYCWGTTLFVGKTEQYTTIQDAVTAASDGDTIMIKEGQYECDRAVEFFDRHHIVMCGSGNVVLTCSNMDDNVFWIINSSDITIRNLTARHTDPPEDALCVGNVFGIDSSDDIVIENCDIQGCGAIGVYIWNSMNIVLRNNYIHDNTIWAVEFEGLGFLSDDQDIDGLTFDGNRIENNGRPVVDEFIGGIIEAEFLGVEINSDVYLRFSDPADGSSIYFLHSPDCEKCTAIIADHNRYIGKYMRIEWQETYRHVQDEEGPSVVDVIVSLEILE
jgi:parallel beta-helix repeat protein